MCNHIRARWNYKKLTFATEELDVLENSYNKYHTYLALALHNAVQNKDANYCKSKILLIILYDLFQSIIIYLCLINNNNKTKCFIV